MCVSEVNERSFALAHLSKLKDLQAQGMAYSGVMIQLLVVLACTRNPSETSVLDDTSETVGTDDTQDTQSSSSPSWEEVRPIFQGHCSRCHSANRLSTYKRLETLEDIRGLRTNILDKLETEPPRGLRMPVAANHTGGCTPEHPAINDKRLSEQELETVRAFLQREDLRDEVDSFPALEPPVVPELEDAVTYTSSEFGVLNDGFLEDPNGDTGGYMDEKDYDEREYDQMEDDWFCIRFNPGRSEAGYLTGVQAETASGQIHLNAQLVIDTTGASADAQAAAEERGSDWYRCDAGLGFSDAIPLWRTVPGGQAVELPEATGLRFDPSWTFVLRADFHTHYDAEEFNRLSQNGVIDREAGTMTWYNQATLRAQWAAPEDIERELQWVMVEPSTSQERESFAVVPGASTLSYQAGLPTDAERYAGFSAEVGMGKNGHTASLLDTGSSSCLASNGDFNPKWIEQAVYAEGAAPVLDGGSTLEIRCDYENKSEETVSWGPEGEAAVWGRKERCSGVVFFYEE